MTTTTVAELAKRLRDTEDALSRAIDDIRRFRSDAIVYRFKEGQSIEQIAKAYELSYRDVEGYLRGYMNAR